VQRINVLETIIDSLGANSQDSIASIYADSLLRIETSNFTALRAKGVGFFNTQDFEVAIKLFGRALAINPTDTTTLMFLGWSFDEIGMLDSAKHYYSLGIPLITVLSSRAWILPRLVTITKGKDEGLKILEEIKERINECVYFQMKNDIVNYQNEGMGAFYPLLSLPAYDFYIKIPDELFDSGQLNSIDKIHTFFAKRGINVMFKSSESSNKACVISTSEKYLDKLLEFDSLSIKRL
jgi:tetratricopeptide (TPR) repeat protein